MEIEITKISDTEFLVGKTIIKKLEHDIIYIEAHGEQTDDSAKAHQEAYKKLRIIGEYPMRYLINLNDAGKNSPGARSMWQELGEIETTIKVALYGLHPVAKVLASFVIGIKGKKNSKFFSNREDAIAWLLE